MSQYIVLGVLLLFLGAAIFELRRDYPHEIYGIWYIFFLFFLLFGALYFIAEKENTEVVEALGPSFVAALSAVHHMLTDLQGELLLVAAIVYVGILPQLLTYLFSGLSGSASAPIFVRQIGLIAIWSLIKFMAGLGGILLAQWVAKLYWDKPAPLTELNKAVVFVAFAFATAATQHRYFDRPLEIGLAPGLRVGLDVPLFTEVHRLFTRHRETEVVSTTYDVAKDAAIIAATATAQVAVMMARDPSKDAVEIASRVVATVAAIEAATREANESAAQKKVAEREISWRFKHVTVRVRGKTLLWHLENIQKLTNPDIQPAERELLREEYRKKYLWWWRKGESANRSEGKPVDKPEESPGAPPQKTDIGSS